MRPNLPRRIPPRAADTQTGTVELTINGRRVAVQVKVPVGDVPPAKLLPLYRSIAELLTNLAVKNVEAAGHRVTCAKGCGACCRQLVPISALEARELVKLVERMPEPRRTVVKQRFAEIRRRLEQDAPHLLPHLLNPQDAPEPVLETLGDDYFALGMACPFLEGESCSIYADRPTACRQYLVVSNPVHCSELKSDNVRAIQAPPGPVSRATPSFERSPGGRPVDWVTLTLSPDFVARHPQEPAPRAGTQLVEQFFNRLTGGADKR